MAKELACIDTDICVDFLRKKEPGFNLLLKLIEHYSPSITAITVFELFLGHFKMKRKDKIDDFIDQFVLLPFDRKASEASASIQASLDKKGKGIGIPDLLIAGICVANSVPLLTLNTKHFSRVSGLKLITF
jgi:tRNA(fMet)-specific endonuclease VapC